MLSIDAHSAGRHVKRSRPNTLKHILQTRRHCAGLLQLARAHSRTTEQVRALLPTELAPHLVAASVEGRRLVLLAASPAWASRLRYARSAVTAGMAEVDEIKVRVTPPSLSAAAAAPARRAIAISESSARLICEIAQSIADPDLRLAVLKLSTHGGKQKAD